MSEQIAMTRQFFSRLERWRKKPGGEKSQSRATISKSTSRRWRMNSSWWRLPVRRWPTCWRRRRRKPASPGGLRVSGHGVSQRHRPDEQGAGPDLETPGRDQPHPRFGRLRGEGDLPPGSGVQGGAGGLADFRRRTVPWAARRRRPGVSAGRHRTGASARPRRFAGGWGFPSLATFLSSVQPISSAE